MKNNTKNKKFSWKKFGIWVLIILSIVSVFGIIFSTWNFTKNSEKNNSKDVGDKLQLTYNVTLDVDKKATADEQNKAIYSQLKSVANSLYEQTKKQNINDFEITYGIPKQTDVNQNGNNPSKPNIIPSYGEINLILSVNDSGLQFNQKIALSKFKDNEKEIKKDPKAALNQQLKYFYRFANNFNLKLLKYNTPANDESILGAFDKYAYQLNRVDDVSLDDTGKIGKFKLQPAVNNQSIEILENDKNWNLSSMQKEFVESVNVQTNAPTRIGPTRDTTTKTYWEDADYDNDAAATAFLENNKFTNVPKSQYLIWNNRSDLVHRLQMATFAALINNNKTMFPASSKEIFIATNLSKSLSIYEQDFGYWLANKNAANANFLDSTIFDDVNPKNDKLINLLNGYYSTEDASIPNIDEGDRNIIVNYKRDNKSTGNDKKFLYSWNLEKNQLINKSLLAIDYGNFFKYFENNNAEWLKENDKAQFYGANYFTKNFTITESSYTPSNISFKNYVELLNKSQPTNYYFDNALTDLFNKSNSWSDPTFVENKVKNSTLKIIDYLSIYSQTSLNTIIHLPTYFAAFLGLFLVILAIGILVSVLYRVPGFIAAITTTLSFTLSCLMYSSLGLSFSFGTYLLLAVVVVLTYIPIIYFLDYIRMGINKGYNLWNSFKYALRKFSKIFFGIYISLLIFGIVFLFFGFLQIQSFGVLLVIASLLGIIINGVLYATALWTLVVCIENKYNILVPQKYVDALNIIKSTTFQSALLEIKDEQPKSITAKVADKIDFKYQSKNWLMWLVIVFGIIALAGLIPLLLIGPGFSLDYTNGTLISLISNKEVPTDVINSILSSLGYTLIDKHVNISADYVETILVFNATQVNWNDVANAIHNALPSTSVTDPFILTSFSLLENSTLTSFEISNNIIKCLFIAFGFFTIWSFIWLNIVNVIPVFLLQSINVFIIAGLVGLTRIPFTVNSLISLLSVVIFFSALTFGFMSDFKVNFNTKKPYTKDELVAFVRKQVAINSDKMHLFIGVYLIVNVLLIIFMSSTFWFSLLISIISICVLYFINYYLTPIFFICGMLLRKVFSQERHKLSISKYLHNVETGSSDKTKDFDKVDEQEIYGLNKFRIKEVR